MKTFLIVFFLSILLFILVYSSNMIESHRVIEMRGGVEYVRIENEVRWDRLFDYMTTLPGEMLLKARSRLFSKFEVD